MKSYNELITKIILKDATKNEMTIQTKKKNE